MRAEVLKALAHPSRIFVGDIIESVETVLRNALDRRVAAMKMTP